jgi:hypothetical protein
LRLEQVFILNSQAERIYFLMERYLVFGMRKEEIKNVKSQDLTPFPLHSLCKTSLGD